MWDCGSLMTQISLAKLAIIVYRLLPDSAADLTCLTFCPILEFDFRFTFVICHFNRFILFGFDFDKLSAPIKFFNRQGAVYPDYISKQDTTRKT